MTRVLLYFFLVVLPFVTSSFITAEAKSLKAPELKPLYELGIGISWFSFPDYAGSAHDQKFLLPFPSVLYRGEILRSERDEGVRGRFLNSKRLELDLSADGTFPSKESDNRERQGMGDLDPLLEIGPRLIWHLKLAEVGSPLEISLNLGTRYSFSSDLKYWKERGAAINPFLNFKYEGFLVERGFSRDTYVLSAGAKFATRELQGFYYDVTQGQSTDSRPAYRASSGLMEFSYAAAAFVPVTEAWWVFLGGILASYESAENKKSPLHVRDQAFSIAVGVSWNFHQSPFLVLE